MGNRAVIQIEGQDVGIYLHWNGGLDTIAPLLEVAREYGLRGDDYGIARLTQILGNFLGGTLSIGVGRLDRLDCRNGDNGTYVLDQEFNIIKRLYMNKPEQNVYSFQEVYVAMKKANDEFFKGRR